MLCWRLARLSLQKNVSISNFNRRSVISRSISTSKKNSDSTGFRAPGVAVSYRDPNSKWQSYGFALTEHADRLHMHMHFFFGITVTFLFCGFYVAYAPDEMDWEQREAFLELRRREEQGLPLVDKNYINPSLMVLPSEEELKDAEVII